MALQDRQGFFAPVRGSLASIIALSVLGAASGVVPFIAIVELARTLLPALSGDGIDSGRVWLIVVIAVVALFVSFAAAFGSGLVSHFADAELQLSLRRRIIRHLQRLPLGWFDARSSGRVRKLVEGDVNALHQLVAHAIHDVVTAIVVPLISLVYLFAVQWQQQYVTERKKPGRGHVLLYTEVLFGEGSILPAFGNSVLVALLRVLGELATATLAGYAFAKLHFRGRNIVFIGYLATSLIPAQLLLVPRFVYFQQLGLYDSLWA